MDKFSADAQQAFSVLGLGKEAALPTSSTKTNVDIHAEATGASGSGSAFRESTYMSSLSEIDIELENKPVNRMTHPLRFMIYLTLFALALAAGAGMGWTCQLQVEYDLNFMCVLHNYVVFFLQLLLFIYPTLFRTVDASTATEGTIIMAMFWFLASTICMVVSLVAFFEFSGGLFQEGEEAHIAAEYELDENAEWADDEWVQERFEFISNGLGDVYEHCTECQICAGQQPRYQLAYLAMFSLITSSVWLASCGASGLIHSFCLKEYPFMMGMMIDLARIGKARANIFRRCRGKPSVEEEKEAGTYISRRDKTDQCSDLAAKLCEKTAGALCCIQ